MKPPREDWAERHETNAGRESPQGMKFTTRTRSYGNQCAMRTRLMLPQPRLVQRESHRRVRRPQRLERLRERPGRGVPHRERRRGREQRQQRVQRDARVQRGRRDDQRREPLVVATHRGDVPRGRVADAPRPPPLRLLPRRRADRDVAARGRELGSLIRLDRRPRLDRGFFPRFRLDAPRLRIRPRLDQIAQRARHDALARRVGQVHEPRDIHRRLLRARVRGAEAPAAAHSIRGGGDDEPAARLHDERRGVGADVAQREEHSERVVPQVVNRRGLLVEVRLAYRARGREARADAREMLRELLLLVLFLREGGFRVKRARVFAQLSHEPGGADASLFQPMNVVVRQTLRGVIPHVVDLRVRALVVVLRDDALVPIARLRALRRVQDAVLFMFVRGEVERRQMWSRKASDTELKGVGRGASGSKARRARREAKERRETKSLRNRVHHADAVVRGPA